MSEDPELNLLLNGLIEGSLNPADTQKVREILKKSASARQEYYELVAVELMLAERYEMPEHIAMTAQLMAEDSEGVGRPAGALTRLLGSSPQRSQPVVFWNWKVGAGIAAAFALSWGSYQYLNSRQQDVSVVMSLDSHFEVNGEVSSHGVLKPGDLIEVKHGVVNLALARHVEATLEAPVTLKLGERNGQVQLLSGSAFFNISQGGQGFEIYSPSGVIRDIGTKFGVNVLPTGDVEAHVDEGRIEIERPEGPKVSVTSGYSASWARTGAVVSRMDAEGSFIRFLPNETPLLLENFSESDGTLLNNRTPKIGGKWKVADGGMPLSIRDGHLDTSGGSRHLTVPFLSQDSQGTVYLLTFRTQSPERATDVESMLDAEETISLKDEDGKLLVSLVARADRKHHWQLRDDVTGRLSIGTRISAFEDHTLTLSYDRRRGVVSLFEGSSPQGTIVDDLKLDTARSPEALEIANDRGGDLSLDDLVVRMVTYQH